MDQLFDATVAVSTASALVYFRDQVFRQFLPSNPQIDLTDPSIQKPFLPSVYSSKFICITLPVVNLLLILSQQIVSICLIGDGQLTFGMLNWKAIICFLTGYSVTLLSVLLVKSMVGRKRPNFLASNGIHVDPLTACVTVKGYRMNNLASSSDAVNEVTSFLAKLHPRSSGENVWKADSFRSFYSGHSCVPVFCSVFTILHLHLTMTSNNLSVTSVQIILETIYFLLSLHPGITQGLTFHHNWSDVATGHSVGFVTAFMSFYFFS